MEFCDRCQESFPDAAERFYPEEGETICERCHDALLRRQRPEESEQARPSSAHGIRAEGEAPAGAWWSILLPIVPAFVFAHYRSRGALIFFAIFGVVMGLGMILATPGGWKEEQATANQLETRRVETDTGIRVGGGEVTVEEEVPVITKTTRTVRRSVTQSEKMNDLIARCIYGCLHLTSSSMAVFFLILQGSRSKRGGKRAEKDRSDTAVWILLLELLAICLLEAWRLNG